MSTIPTNFHVAFRMKAYLPQSRDCETPINHVLALSVLIRPLLFGVAGIFAAAIILNPHAAHAALGPNRIANPSLETAATSEDPQGWFRGRWGTNTAVFTYPVAGLEGARAARVALTSRTSGDAKWYFADVPITPGSSWRFTDRFVANIPSTITARFALGNGQFLYEDLARHVAAAGPQGTDVTFTAPQGTVSVTIFHLINTVGTLTIDDYGLQEVLPDSGPNRIANPSLETAATSGDPQGWFRGRWGTNTAVFTYPVAGLEGARAARVALTSRTSGDAKWYFADVPITPGSSWRFTDRFVANIPSTITARFALGNGQFLYEDLMRHTAAAGPQGTDVTFTAPQGTVSVTIFHLINTVGTLTIDDYGLVAASGGDPTEGIVTLTFDDGWKSIYENAIPMLRGAGIKSTQYIATGYLGFPAYITPTEVIAMQNEGHEIGAHSRTHRDLTTVSLAEATEEIAGSRDDLISIGVHSVKTFAYPFGAYNDGLKQILRNEGFVAARSTDNGANIPTMLDAFALKRHRADNSVTAAQIKTWIDEAREEKTWLILALHRIDNDGSAYSTPPAMLQEIIDHLQTTNTRTATVKEGLELFRSN